MPVCHRPSDSFYCDAALWSLHPSCLGVNLSRCFTKWCISTLLSYCPWRSKSMHLPTAVLHLSISGYCFCLKCSRQFLTCVSSIYFFHFPMLFVFFKCLFFKVCSCKELGILLSALVGAVHSVCTCEWFLNAKHSFPTGCILRSTILSLHAIIRFLFWKIFTNSSCYCVNLCFRCIKAVSSLENLNLW